MAVSCGLGRRHGSDLSWLCLWHRPAATALMRLASELPYVVSAALKRQKDKKKKKKRKKKKSKILKVGYLLNAFSYLYFSQISKKDMNANSRTSETIAVFCYVLQ